MDLNKKRKTSEVTSATIKKPTEVTTEAKKEDKPWENKPEEEEDYRWSVCENCQ
jgi:hypothetical protein